MQAAMEAVHYFPCPFDNIIYHSSISIILYFFIYSMQSDYMKYTVIHFHCNILALKSLIV